jgi:queuosine precursor transporter
MKTGIAVIFVCLAVLANWLASRYIVGIALTGGLQAPAGVFCIGGILVLRDWFQQLTSLWRSLALIYVAGVASYAAGVAFGWTSLQRIAVASLVAFTVSETLEAIVFTSLRNRSLTVGVAASSLVGNAVDSWLFRTLAFGSTAFFWGQFWGKTEMIAVGVALTAARRSWIPAEA